MDDDVAASVLGQRDDVDAFDEGAGFILWLAFRGGISARQVTEHLLEFANHPGLALGGYRMTPPIMGPA
jgi:hypothetical protein